MRNFLEIPSKALAFSLLYALLASNVAQARPAPYSKALTFTQTTTASAPGAAHPRYYFPANTKYSSVRLQRAGTDIGMESLEIAHEGLRAASKRPERVAR